MELKKIVSNNFDFSRAVFKWYKTNHRLLPWRSPPFSCNEKDPYPVWLSEIMLQQTGVQTVIPYFLNFMHHYPSLKNLANASLDHVLKLWQGLGYYSRARNLHHCAQVIESKGGHFPREKKLLMDLPGIGDYTASAIGSIAFQKPYLALDGNVYRLLSRFLAIKGQKWKKEIAEQGQYLLPEDYYGDFTQALMDIGSLICTPKKPLCDVCPLAKGCKAFHQNAINDFPPTKVKSLKPKRFGHAIVHQRSDGALLLWKQTKRKLLENLWSLPTTEWLDQQFPSPWSGNFLGTVSHTFTHFHLSLDIWHSHGSGDSKNPSGLSSAMEQTFINDGPVQWVLPEKLSEFAISTLMKKAIQKTFENPSNNSLETLYPMDA